MLKILKWKIKIFYSDKKLVTLLFLIPILIIAVISPSLIGDNNPEITINIIDEDLTQLSQNYKSKIEEDKRIISYDLPYDEGIKEIEKNNISGMLLIKEGFSQKIEKGKNKNLIELIYSKDNYYFKSLTDIFVQHYFGDLAKYRNIEYVLRNYDSIDENRYKLEYENQYEKLENEDLYKFEFTATEIGSKEKVSIFTGKTILLYRYIFGVVFLLAYVVILIQNIETNIKKQGTIEKISLSKINFLHYTIGNLLGSVIPVSMNLTIQLIALSIFTGSVFSLDAVIYILFFSLSIGLLSNLIVKIFKKSENLYLMIPYYIIIIWIFGNILFNLEFLSFFNFNGSILPGAGIKEIIISLMIGTDIDIKAEIIKEISLVLTMSLILISLEYKEFKNVAS